MNRREKNR